MNIHKENLSESKTSDVENLKRLLDNYEQKELKLYASRKHVSDLASRVNHLEDTTNFTIYLFYFENNVQKTAFYLKTDFPSSGNFKIEENPNASYTSFEETCNLIAIDDTTIDLIKSFLQG